MDESAPSVAHALARLGVFQDQVEHGYHRTLDVVFTRGLTTAICTIYTRSSGALPDVGYRRSAKRDTAIYDDIILCADVTCDLPALDLRLNCSDHGDYANPIQPSAQGGGKIVSAMANLLAAHYFTCGSARVFGASAPSA
jgi:hypothetical protein